jgi:hypothetical protein
LYYAFREATFSSPFDLKVQDGKAYITYRAWVTDILYPFPQDLVADVALKKAVLSYNNCREAQLYLKDFMAKLFEGMT